MQPDSKLSATEWVRRVNRTWLVHGGLNAAAERWMDYLAASDPARLDASCLVARAMCTMRDPLADPKPWFYAGLFSLAAQDEVERFIPSFRITKAAIPSMAGDDEVMLWLERVSGETKALIRDLRAALERLDAGDGINAAG